MNKRLSWVSECCGYSFLMLNLTLIHDFVNSTAWLTEHGKAFTSGPDGSKVRVELDEDTFEAGQLGDGAWHTCCSHGYDENNKRVKTLR